jgi:hypothetical protein
MRTLLIGGLAVTPAWRLARFLGSPALKGLAFALASHLTPLGRCQSRPALDTLQAAAAAGAGADGQIGLLAGKAPNKKRAAAPGMS